MSDVSNFQFSHESAFPKQNPNPQNRQFITSSAENYILIWDLKRPPTDVPIAVPGQMGTKITEEDDDDDVFQDEEEKEEEEKKKKEKEEEEKKPKKAGWGTIKTKSTQILMSAFGGDKKWTPAVGRYWFMRDILTV